MREDHRYHDDATSKYLLPNDASEHDRLDTQHAALLALMHDQPFHSPIDPSSVNVALDIGCGTGAMTLAIAHHFPNATVYGIDLSSIPASTLAEAEHLNGRVHFLQGNILSLASKHPALQRETVDFVFHRLLVAGMSSYFVYLRDAVTPLLKPGGWVEMHDLLGPASYFFDTSTGPVQISDNWLFARTLQSKMAARGLGRRDGEAGFEAIVSTLQMLDFEHVHQKLYKLPWAPVAGKPEMEAWTRYGVKEQPALFVGALRRMLVEDGAKEAEIEAVERNCWETLGSARDGLWCPFIVAWGQKPLVGE